MSTVKETEVLNVDLMETPVTFRSKVGKETVYVSEMTGDSLETFMRENKDRFVMETDLETGKAKVKALKSFDGLFSILLKHCLQDSNHKPVPEAKIKALPPRVQKRLMEIAQQVNALTPDAQESVGNSPTGNGPGCMSVPGVAAVPSPDSSGKPEPGSSING